MEGYVALNEEAPRRRVSCVKKWACAAIVASAAFGLLATSSSWPSTASAPWQRARLDFDLLLRPPRAERLLSRPEHLLTGPGQLRPRNIDYLGQGVDITQDPWADEGSTSWYREPVVRVAQGFRMSGDGKWEIPEHVNFLPRSECTYTGNFSMHGTVFGLQASLSQGIDFHANLYEVLSARFSQSALFKAQSEKDGQSLSTFVHSQCQMYEASFDWEGQVVLSDTFMEAVRNLPTNLDAGQYADFVQRFGTAVLTGIAMGGKAIRTVSFASEKLDAKLSMGLNLEFAAGVDFHSYFGIGEGSHLADQASALLDFQDAKVDESVRCLGARGTCPPRGSSDPTEWLAQVRQDPVPVGMSVVGIQALLNSKLFPHVDMIDRKADNLASFIGSMYCRSNPGCQTAAPSAYRRASRQLQTSGKGFAATISDAVTYVSQCDSDPEILKLSSSGTDVMWTQSAGPGVAQGCNVAAAFSGDGIYLVGGYAVPSTSAQLSLHNGYAPQRWYSLSPLPVPGLGSCAVVHRSSIYVMGGSKLSWVRGLPHKSSFAVDDGPVAADGPRTYSCKEACANVFGGHAEGWVGSTAIEHADGKCFTAEYGHTGCRLHADDFKRCDTYSDNGCTSAYVQQAYDCHHTNYCFQHGSPIVPQRTMQVFDVNTNSWSETPAQMLIGRSNCSAVAVQDMILAIGGWSSGGTPLTSVEAFDGTSWHRLPDMNVPRTSSAAVVFRGEVYVIGGLAEDQTPLMSVEKLSLATQVWVWQDQLQLPVPRFGHAATVKGNDIFVMGGQSAVGGDFIADVTVLHLD